MSIFALVSVTPGSFIIVVVVIVADTWISGITAITHTGNGSRAATVVTSRDGNRIGRW